jgi:hypothetical protein
MARCPKEAFLKLTENGPIVSVLMSAITYIRTGIFTTRLRGLGFIAYKPRKDKKVAPTLKPIITHKPNEQLYILFNLN